MKNRVIWLMLKYISLFYEILLLSFLVSLLILFFHSLSTLILVKHMYAHTRNLGFPLK